MKRGMRVKTLHMLACDMGASNGRIVYGILEDGTLIIRELHRFVNRPVRLGGVLYWDFFAAFPGDQEWTCSCREGRFAD